MGIELSVVKSLTKLTAPVNIIYKEFFTIIQCSPSFYLHFIPLYSSFDPLDLIKLQESFQEDKKVLVHLWEDIWLSNQAGVLSRVKSFLGLNQTLHGRKTKIKEINSLEAIAFFNNYHLQGYVKSKYCFGLTFDNELVAVASFSDLRSMKLKGDTYKSAELVRFASKDGYTVTGGLSKLIKHFIGLKKPNDIMSYADRDWSLGKGYDQLGFEFTSRTPAAYLYVEQKTGLRYFTHRLPKKVLLAFDKQKELNLTEYLAEQGFVQVFNTGNLKYHLYL